MANALCPPAKPLQGRSFRATQLDECGSPLLGDDAYGVSDGQVSVAFTPNREEGERFLSRSASGAALINQRSRPLLNWYDVTIVLQEIDPELVSLLTGSPRILDYSTPPLTVGFSVTESTFALGSFALEVWTGNAEEACPEPPAIQAPWYGYFLLPWVVEGAHAEAVEVGNDLINLTITGRTRKGNRWGTGPYDVVLDNLDQPAPLADPVPTDAHWHPLWTQLPPPVAVCGVQSLFS